MTIDIPSRFTTTAVLYKSDKGDYYRHFGIFPMIASIYGDKPEEIVTVILEVIPGVTIKNRKKTQGIEYWGLFDFRTKTLGIIYPAWLLFYVCFPNGPQGVEDANQGKCLNLKIIEVKPYEPTPEDSNKN